jgi:hypothetical protein
MKAVICHSNVKMTHTHRTISAFFHLFKNTKFRKLFPLLSSHEYIILTLLIN